MQHDVVLIILTAFGTFLFLCGLELVYAWFQCRHWNRRP